MIDLSFTLCARCKEPRSPLGSIVFGGQCIAVVCHGCLEKLHGLVKEELERIDIPAELLAYLSPLVRNSLKSAPPVASSHADAIGGSSALHSYGGVLAP